MSFQTAPENSVLWTGMKGTSAKGREEEKSLHLCNMMYLSTADKWQTLDN